MGEASFDWSVHKAVNPNRLQAVLWDNGPLITDPGACSGMDASRLQGALGLTIYGFGTNSYLATGWLMIL